MNQTLQKTEAFTLENLHSELKGIIKDDNYAVNFVECILKWALKLSASDVHIECLADKVNVKMRLDGMLVAAGYAPFESKTSILTRLKYLSKLAVYQSAAPQDGRLTYEHHDVKTDLRISFLPTIYGEKVVIRYPEKNQINFDINKLGMPEQVKNTLISIAERRQGIILLTGPSSSGKTTTIYSLLKYLYLKNGEAINISTIEDPVEQGLGFLNQTQVYKEQGLTYLTGLKSILRQDPDIIMIGEIRDPETASISIQAGLTGHLMISTVHSNQAIGVFPRLIHMNLEPFLVASAVQCVLSQRLIRILCPACKKKYVPEQKYPGLNTNDNVSIYQAAGCDRCNYTGYNGRTGIYEIVSMTEELEDIIISKAPASEFLKFMISGGIKTLADDGFSKIKEGITSPDEVLRVVPVNKSEDKK